MTQQVRNKPHLSCFKYIAGVIEAMHCHNGQALQKSLSAPICMCGMTGYKPTNSSKLNRQYILCLFMEMLLN
jgi:hypothetical protein